MGTAADREESNFKSFDDFNLEKAKMQVRNLNLAQEYVPNRSIFFFFFITIKPRIE